MTKQSATSTEGRSLELFFIDGRADGMLTAEVFNWTGHVLVTPRTQISTALKRKQAQHTGVYILFGEKDGESVAYIGEGQNISERIRNHDYGKDWWDTAVLVTTTADNLNKAHVQYLEARLIEEARDASKIKLENGKSPTLPSLTEAAQTNMEVFLEYTLMILPALRIDCFIRNTRSSSRDSDHAVTETDIPLFELHAKKNNIYAKAKLMNGEFVVQSGSHARHDWYGDKTESSSYRQLYYELVRIGVLVESEESKSVTGDLRRRVFKEDYAFRSPSAAASVVVGRIANGTTEWKVRDQKKTYKEWEREQITQLEL